MDNIQEHLNRSTRFDNTTQARKYSQLLVQNLGSFSEPNLPRALAKALTVCSYNTIPIDARTVLMDGDLRLGPDGSPDMEAFIRDAVSLAAPHTVYATKLLMTVSARYVLWCTNQGWPLDPETIWSVRAIDIYSTTANQDRSEGTRRNYRALLMRISEVLLPDEHPERPTPLSSRSTATPYTDFEMRLFRRWAGDQLTPLKRDRAMLMLVLCAGAGLRPSELPFLRHDDIEVDGEGVLIHVAGRDVPLLAEWEEWMLVLLERRPREHVLWGPINRQNTSNLTSTFTENSHGNPPRADRLRHTWFTHHLTVGVPMKDLMRAAGIRKFQQLHLLLEHVELRNDADYRRIFRSEVQR